MFPRGSSGRCATMLCSFQFAPAELMVWISSLKNRLSREVSVEKRRGFRVLWVRDGRLRDHVVLRGFRLTGCGLE